VKRGPAENFAKGGGGARAEQTISVMAIRKVTNARDVRNLSIFGASQEEWLLLPGSRLLERQDQGGEHRCAGQIDGARVAHGDLTQTA